MAHHTPVQMVSAATSPLHHDNAEAIANALMAVKHSRPSTPNGLGNAHAFDPKFHTALPPPPPATLSGTPSNPLQAYAKLQGEDFTYYMQSLSLLLGRRSSPTDLSIDVDLGNTRVVSRKHARIEYNFVKRQFELRVLGKNGVYVDGIFHPADSEPVPLETKTLLQMGETCFYFLLPLQKNSHDHGIAAPRGARGKPLQRRPSDFLAPSTGVSAAPTPGTMTPLSVSSPPSPPDSPEEANAPYRRDHTIKPPYSYATMIAQAIHSTSHKRMTLSGIYAYIMHHYPFYRVAQNGWQNSIRHNLSLNKAFVRVPRAENEPGKGSFWTIDPAHAHLFQKSSKQKKLSSSSSSSPKLEGGPSMNNTASFTHSLSPARPSLGSLLITSDVLERRRLQGWIGEEKDEEETDGKQNEESGQEMRDVTMESRAAPNGRGQEYPLPAYGSSRGNGMILFPQPTSDTIASSPLLSSKQSHSPARYFIPSSPSPDLSRRGSLASLMDAVAYQRGEEEEQQEPMSPQSQLVQRYYEPHGWMTPSTTPKPEGIRWAATVPSGLRRDSMSGEGKETSL